MLPDRLRRALQRSANAEKIAVAAGHDQPSGLRHDFFQCGEMSLSLIERPEPADLAAGLNDEEQPSGAMLRRVV